MNEKVTEKEVGYVADLANLELTADERTRMVRDLNSILGFIDTLNELDTTNVPPMAQVTAVNSSDTAKHSELREDASRPSLSHDAALQNAPEHDHNFFKVPKVIER
ncbi:MAG: aspartyl/glutamyl-tRNA(Asn/Gln) amidotransferase subunit [Acidobacteriales bacterium]|nr:aspartyl/glutamyl-tRNA(Asn/Gln) amidotransferase subunit [Terriglobales bacterium]